MIISKTPLRISFVGGGTDLRSYYQNSYGAVLSTTIDKHVYVVVKDRFDDLIYVNWSKKEIVESVDDIEHDLVRESLKKIGIEKGIEITTLADIPSEGSGLGSSSSLTVGLLNALYTFVGDQVSSERLAREACEIEIDQIGKPIGKQDHYAAAFGGMNEIVFNKDESVVVNRINLPNDKLRILGSNLLLFYTGITRKADKILKKQQAKTEQVFDLLTEMRDQVPALRDNLERGDLDSLGKTLNQAWEKKKSLLPEISNKQIEDIYTMGMKCGCIGGKICGAGGGGFFLFYVPREKQNQLRYDLKAYREFPFLLDKYGSRIIFNQQSDYWK